MKTGFLIVSGCIDESKFYDLYFRLTEAAKRINIDLEIKKNTEFLVSVTDETVSGLSKRPDFVLFWDKDISLAKGFENLNIPVFNCSEAISICDDKYLTHLILAKYNIRMPNTFKIPFAFSGMEYLDSSFISILEDELDYPFIIKATNGSFGNQVYLINNKNELLDILMKNKGVSLIAQEYIPSSFGRDLRMYMVGDTCAAAIIRNNEKDFRATTNLGGFGTAYEPSNDQIQLAKKIMNIIGLDFAGIDFLFDKEEKLILCEVNSNAHFKELYDATSINVAVNIMEYIDVKI